MIRLNKPREMLETIVPAIRTPMITAKKALFHFTPKSQLRNEPEYAPVNGKGIATSSTKPIRPYFLT